MRGWRARSATSAPHASTRSTGGVAPARWSTSPRRRRAASTWTCGATRRPSAPDARRCGRCRAHACTVPCAPAEVPVSCLRALASRPDRAPPRMPPAAASRTRHGAKPLDDFEWPPTADELSVYELGPDPWQKLQDASSQVLVARRREASRRRPISVVERAPQPTRTYGTLARALVLAACAVVAVAAGWILYRTATTRPLPVNAIHHPVPPAADITA